jgi:hypothetical protein
MPSDPIHIAVLKLQEVLSERTEEPIATFPDPIVLSERFPCQRAVL